MFKLYFFLFVAIMNTLINGYDTALVTALGEMDGFQEYVHIIIPISINVHAIIIITTTYYVCILWRARLMCCGVCVCV